MTTILQDFTNPGVKGKAHLIRTKQGELKVVAIDKHGRVDYPSYLHHYFIGLTDMRAWSHEELLLIRDAFKALDEQAEKDKAEQ